MKLKQLIGDEMTLFLCALHFTNMIVMGIIVAISLVDSLHFEGESSTTLPILIFFISAYLFFSSILSLIK